MKTSTNLWRHRQRRHGGQGMVETALVLAIFLFPLTLGLMQYGIYLQTVNTLTQLAREGGRYAALHGTESTYETGTEDYIQTIALNTSIKPSDLPDANITVVTVPSTALRVSGNPIQVSITYSMKKKIFVGRLFPFLSDSYVAQSTFIIE